MNPLPHCTFDVLEIYAPRISTTRFETVFTRCWNRDSLPTRELVVTFFRALFSARYSVVRVQRDRSDAREYKLECHLDTVSRKNGKETQVDCFSVSSGCLLAWSYVFRSKKVGMCARESLATASI